MTITRSTITDIAFAKATGSAAISETLAPGVPWKIESIRLHLSSVGGSGTFTASINSGSGSAYDIVLLTQDMTIIEDLIWTPNKPIKFDAGDEINIAWSNANSKTYGLEIIWETI